MSFKYGLDSDSFWMMTEILSSRAQNFLECVSAVNAVYYLCQYIHTTCRNYMKGLKALKKVKWCCKVDLWFFQFCELGQFHRPWLMSNYIWLQILNCQILLEIFEIGRLKFLLLNISMYIIFLSIKTLLLKVKRIDRLKIHELFWYVKCKIEFWGKYKKILDTNGHAF